MVVMDAVADLAAVQQAQLVPRGGPYIAAPVFVPLDVRFVTEHRCVCPTRIDHGQELPEVQAYAVIEVRVPANGRLMPRLTAYKDVIRRLTYQDELQAFLQGGALYSSRS